MTSTKRLHFSTPSLALSAKDLLSSNLWYFLPLPPSFHKIYLPFVLKFVVFSVPPPSVRTWHHIWRPLTKLPQCCSPPSLWPSTCYYVTYSHRGLHYHKCPPEGHLELCHKSDDDWRGYRVSLLRPTTEQRANLSDAYDNTGCPKWAETWLCWLGFWVFHYLPDSAWADGNLAEAAGQLGKKVESNLTSFLWFLPLWIIQTLFQA